MWFLWYFNRDAAELFQAYELIQDKTYSYQSQIGDLINKAGHWLVYNIITISIYHKTYEWQNFDFCINHKFFLPLIGENCRN